MSSPNSSLDLDVQVEEWAVRYRQLEGSLQEQLSSNDNETMMDLMVSKAIMTRAGRLGALQCAAKKGPSSQSLFHHTRLEMENDDVQLCTDHWMQKVAEKVRSAVPAAGNREAKTSVERQTNDADALFEEYPDCVRPGWAEMRFSDGDESSSDEDDENVHDGKRAAREATSNKKVKQPLHQALELQQKQNAVAQVPQERPASAHGRPGAPRNNPYQKQVRQQPPPPPTEATHRQPAHTSSGFDYPPSIHPRNEPPTAGSWGNQQTASHQGAVPDPSRYPQQTQRNNGNRAPSRQQPYQSTYTSSTSWENHTNQQNPFFTAREMAQIIVDDEPQQHRQQQTQRQQQQPVRAAGDSNPYASYYPVPQPPNMNEIAADDEVAKGGPSIPDSLRRKFQPPKRVAEPANSNNNGKRKPSGFAPSAKGGGVQTTRPSSSSGRSGDDDDDELPEELQHLDKELVKKIQNEIMESGDTVTFDDIAGLEDAKQTVQEVVCWPMKRPDLFTGLRRAPNGLLLYGPPGTGKTLIGKAIAHESGATFFSISSSSLTSKWIGEGEKLVKTLFAVAAYREPAVVFIDEIDSLLTQRSANENEASRRIKTEFLVQLDGTGTSGQGRVLVIGATNKPQELDEAARRRFTKRLYIPLPVEEDRRILIHVMLKKNNHQLTELDISSLAKDTEGFSGADLKALCTDAAMGPIRQLGPRALEVQVTDVPPITFKHFKRSLKGTKPSVAPSDLVQYEEWDKIYGSKRASEEDDDDDDDNDE